MTNPDQVNQKFNELMSQVPEFDVYEDYDRVMSGIYQLLSGTAQYPELAVNPAYKGAIENRRNNAVNAFRAVINHLGWQHGFGSEEFIEASAKALIRADQEIMDFVGANLPGCDFSEPRNNSLEDTISEISQDFDGYIDEDDEATKDSDYTNIVLDIYDDNLESDLDTIYNYFCEQVITNQYAEKLSADLDEVSPTVEARSSVKGRLLGSAALVSSGIASGAALQAIGGLFGRIAKRFKS